MHSGQVYTQWVNEKQVSALTGISLSTLRKYRLWGKGPTYSKIGRSVRYALADVLEYMESRRIQLRG